MLREQLNGGIASTESLDSCLMFFFNFVQQLTKIHVVIKVPMKRKFVQLHVVCMAKIAEDDNVTSLVEYL